jgi:valyl-tRNA synthetase
MDVIDKYGADALRIALVLSSAPGNDQRYSAERVESGSHFANKIYNATRFVLMNLSNGPMAAKDTPSHHLADRWIRYRLNRATREITSYLENFEFGQAARVIYDFLWDDFCDWYIELAKVRLKSSSEREQAIVLRTLVDVEQDALKLLHPFMPFVTEELWHALPHQGDSIMVTQWPGEQLVDFNDDDQKQFQALQDLIRGIRNLRAELTLPPSKRADVTIWVDDQVRVDQLQTVLEEISELGRLSHVTILARTDDAISKPPHAISQVVSGATIYMPLEGLVDIDKESSRLSKLLETTRAELDRVRRQLADPNFCQRAPQAVVEKARMSEQDLEIRLARLQERLEDLA